MVTAIVLKRGSKTPPFHLKMDHRVAPRRGTRFIEHTLGPLSRREGGSGGGGRGAAKKGGHEATDTGLAYAPVSQAHGHQHTVQGFASLPCSADQFCNTLGGC